MRASHFSKLCDEIGWPFILHMKKACPNASAHLRKRSMCFHAAKTGFYVHQLYRVGLWPIDYTTAQLSIQEISNRLEGFQDYYLEGPEIGGRPCDLANIDFTQHLKDARAKMIPSSGLCLNCVKKGKIRRADGNCRAASLELCKNLF